jgi:glycosyltransferase involved in cell wall biosynthesis
MFGKYSRPRLYFYNGINLLSRFIHPHKKSTVPVRRNYRSKPVVLIISHKDKQCGIQQYGVNIAEALSHSKKYEFIYCECDNKHELDEYVKYCRPSAIIYNYYITTMAWLNSWITKSYSIPQFGIMHEVYQEEADKATDVLFDYHLCPDPTLVKNNPIVFKTPRLIPAYKNTKPLPEIPTIGSFGFGIKDKGFDRLIEIIQEEFDVANIHILMPFNDILDQNGTRFTLAIADRCRKLVKKPGINLKISHEFLSKQEVLDFLASNTINAFFYDVDKYKGISSTIEHALAVQRPIAINKCKMFRHVFNAKPPICIEYTTLKETIANGISPLIPFCNEWTEDKFIQRYEQIMDEVIN